MLTGFEKIVEEKILASIRKGEFDNLKGSGKPLKESAEDRVPEDLRMAYRILKNADFIPPEIELKKEIQQTEDILAGIADVGSKYKLLKKLNFLILKLNSMRTGSASLDVPQHYEPKVLDKLENRDKDKS